MRSAFLAGLAQSGHTSTVSDLYAMGFRSELSAAEYERESAYDSAAPVPEDVASEQAKLAAADAWVFIYPLWWSDCPAILKGWFDRVWTVGFREKVRARRALMLCTAGYTAQTLEATGLLPATRTIMLTDRIAGRAEHSDFAMLGGSVANGQEWPALRQQHLSHARSLGQSI